MREIIHDHVENCGRQMRNDRILTLISLAVINGLLCYLYWERRVLLVSYVGMAWLVHAGVMLYCRRLWTIRMRKWQKMERTYDIMEKAEALLLTSKAGADEKLFSLAK